MKILRLAPIAALALSLAACGSEPAQEANPDAAPGISIAKGRLVMPAVMGNPGAAYFELTNGGDLGAVAAAVFIDGAENAEMHVTEGGTMKAVDALNVAPGETVAFEPGGKHVMAFGLKPDLSPGSTVEMTVTFTDGDKVSAPLTVEAPGGGGMEGMGH